MGKTNMARLSKSKASISMAKGSLGRTQSIRGQISSPIPVSSALHDEATAVSSNLNQVANYVAQEQTTAAYFANEQPSRSNVPRFYEHLSSAENTPVSTGFDEARYELPAATVTESSSYPDSSIPRSIEHQELPAETVITQDMAKQAPKFPISASTTNLPQRKKSTIRVAISRLFGRKRDTIPIESLKQTPLDHLEQPQSNASHNPKRSRASLDFSRPVISAPLTDYDRALRSHSINPDELFAIESIRSSAYEVQGSSSRPRAATLSEAFTIQEEEYIGNETMRGLSPRPFSHFELDNERPDTIDDTDSIGMAITSDIVLLKRRSRSLSVLPNLGAVQLEPRRKSEDNRVWRDMDEDNLASPLSGTYPSADELNAFTLDLPTVDDKETAGPAGFGYAALVSPIAESPIELEAIEAPTLKDRVDTVEDRLSRLEDVVISPINSMIIMQDGTGKLKKAPGLTVDHVNSLLDLLENERAARIDLETQVNYLAHQVTYLLSHGSTPSNTITSPYTDASHRVAETSPLQTSTFEQDEDEFAEYDEDEDDDEYTSPFEETPRGSPPFHDSGLSKDADSISDFFVTPQIGSQQHFVVYDEHDQHIAHEARVISISNISMDGMPTHVI